MSGPDEPDPSCWTCPGRETPCRPEGIPRPRSKKSLHQHLKVTVMDVLVSHLQGGRGDRRESDGDIQLRDNGPDNYGLRAAADRVELLLLVVQEGCRLADGLHRPEKENVFGPIQLNAHETVDLQQSAQTLYKKKEVN